MVLSAATLESGTTRRRTIGGGTVVAALAAAVLLAIVVLALFPRCSPRWILAADPANSLQPPSAAHPFGTDQLGRDVFTRVIHGARTSLALGIGAVLVSLAGGILIGVLAGLSRGVLDRVLSRVLDILFAFPDLLIAIVLVALLGVSLPTLLVAIGLGAIPGYARILRSQVRLVRMRRVCGGGPRPRCAGLPRRRPARHAQRDRSAARARNAGRRHCHHRRLCAELRRPRRSAAPPRSGA